MSEFRRSSDYWRSLHEMSAKILSKYPTPFYLIEENIKEQISEQMRLIKDQISPELEEFLKPEKLKC